MASVSASMATLRFNQEFAHQVRKYKEDKILKQHMMWNLYKDCYYQTIYEAMNKGAMFDSRVFSIPKDEVCNCLIWRQQDATRNSIEAAGQRYFSHKQLMNKSCSDIQEMLFQEHGINWNDYPTAFKRGSACYRVCEEVEVIDKVDREKKIATRSHWIVDENIPIFTQDRNFIERWIDFE